MPQTWPGTPVTADNSANAAGYDGGGYPGAPVVDAQAPAPAQPAATVIPNAQPIDPRNPNPPAPDTGPLIAGQDEVRFGDGSGASGPNRRLDPAQENQLMGIIWKGPVETAAANGRAYMASIGWPVAPTAFDAEVAMRRQGQKPGWVQYEKPKPFFNPNEAESAIVGVGSDIPGVNKIQAALDSASVAVGGAGKGDPNQSFRDNYLSTLDRVEATDAKAWEDHPYYYGGGALAGMLAIPTDAPAFASRRALEAGTEVLRASGTMTDARAAAQVAYRRAFSNRSAVEMAAYSGVRGAADADNMPDAIRDGTIGAVEGAVGGKVFGDIGARVFGSPTVAAAERNASRPVADIAADLGIMPTPATVGGSPASTLQTGLASLPGSAPAVAAAADREISGLGNATRNIAESYGEPGTPASTGENIVNAAKAYKADSRTEASQLYDARDAAFNGREAPVVLRNTAGLADKFRVDFPTSDAIKELSGSAIVNKILGVGVGDVGAGATREITLGEAADALSHIKGAVRNLEANKKASGLIVGRAKQLQTALEKDVYESAAAADQAAGRVPGAQGSAVKAQRDADAYYADRAATLKGPLGKALNSAADPSKVSPESVYAQVAADTAVKGGNLERLRKTWFRLPEEARGRFAATLLDDLGRPQASNRTIGTRFMEAVGLKGNDEARLSDGMAWSPETFLTGFNKMSPAARRVVFGKEGEAQILDIARYASRLRETGRFRNFSNTAQSTLTAGALYAIASTFMHGEFTAGGAEVAGLVGSYGAAKLFLATPKMRAWTLSALKAVALPPKAQAAAQKVLLERLPGIARAEPVFGPQILDLKKALTGARASSPNLAAANEPGNSASVADWDSPQYESDSYGAAPAAANDAAPYPAPANDPANDPSAGSPYADGGDGNNADWTGQ